jgi:hypothetical protein
MWKSIWQLFLAPFVVLFKGELYGHPAERNPLRYLSLWGSALVALLFVIFIFPFYILATLLGLAISAIFDNDARINDFGIEVFTRFKGVVAKYKWEEIEMIIVEFNPPFPYPELILKHEERVSLKLADPKQLEEACKNNDVKFVNKLK